MRLRYIGLLALVVLFASCGGSKKVVKRGKKSSTHIADRQKHDLNRQIITDIEDLPNPLKMDLPEFKSDVALYIYQYQAVAKEEMVTFGIPASITLAQGILESGSGKSELVRKSNNHFGIKCHDWTGARVYHDDDLAQECFRKYDNPNYSYRDHSLFLKNRGRYKNLFDLAIDDYKGWARGLKAAGYATDPTYAQKLIRIIEDHDLHQYDLEVIDAMGGKPHPPAQGAKGFPERTYTVKKGDTLYNISNRFGVSVEELKKRNKLKNNDIKTGQKLIIISR